MDVLIAVWEEELLSDCVPSLLFFVVFFFLPSHRLTKSSNCRQITHSSCRFIAATTQLISSMVEIKLHPEGAYCSTYNT